jgi:5-aminolevulinate synthase
MNLNYNDFFKKSIDDLKLENRYREFVNLERICGEFPYAINKANNKKIIIWCSNDYLGMGQNPLAINKAQLAISKFGIGAGGTRNISGNSYAITELENLVAKLHNKDAGLVFSSGYVANDASIQALVKIIPENFDKKKIRELAIKDNISFGENDWDILAKNCKCTYQFLIENYYDKLRC